MWRAEVGVRACLRPGQRHRRSTSEPGQSQCPKPSRAWRRRLYSRRSSSPTAPARPCATPPTSSRVSGRSLANSSTPARLTCWRTWTSLPSTGRVRRTSWFDVEQHEPPRAAQQGGETTRRRRRHPLQQGIDHQADRRRAAGTRRQVAEPAPHHTNRSDGRAYGAAHRRQPTQIITVAA